MAPNDAFHRNSGQPGDWWTTGIHLGAGAVSSSGLWLPAADARHGCLVRAISILTQQFSTEWHSKAVRAHSMRKHTPTRWHHRKSHLVLICSTCCVCCWVCIALPVCQRHSRARVVKDLLYELHPRFPCLPSSGAGQNSVHLLYSPRLMSCAMAVHFG